MSYNLAQIAGSTIPSSGSPVALKTAASGAVIIANASQVFFYVQIGGTGNFHLLPNNVGDIFEFDEGASYVSLIPQYTVITGGANPDKLSFIVLSANEYKRFRGNYPVVLGGQIGVASVTNIANDGNPAGTVFIEGTAGADTPSDVTLTNDGHMTTRSRYTWSGIGIGAGFPIGFEMLPAGATVNNNWALLYAGNDGRFVIQDTTNNKTAIQISPGGSVGLNMGVGNVGGQATVGGFGVPVVVASSGLVNVVATTAQTILSFTPSASGRYRITATILANGTSPANMSLSCTYHEDKGNVTHNPQFAQILAGTVSVLTNLSSATPAGINPFPIAFYADTTAPITLTYQNTQATPNDWVSGIIERIG